MEGGPREIRFPEEFLRRKLKDALAGEELSPWERDFAESVLRRPRWTERQRRVITRIVEAAVGLEDGEDAGD